MESSRITEVGGLLMLAERKLAGLTDAAASVAKAVPHALPDAASSWLVVAAPVEGERPFLARLMVIVAASLSCWLVVALVRQRTRAVRARCASDPVMPRGAIGLLLVELIDRAALFAVAYAAMLWWFNGDSPRDRLAVAILWSSIRWSLLMLAVGAVLRPGCPSLRLIAIGDRSARVARGYAACLLAFGIAVISLMPLMLGVGLPIPSAQVLALLLGILVAGGSAVGLIHLWRIERSGKDAGRTSARLSLPIALALTGALWIVWSVDVLLLGFAGFHALVWSIGLIALVYFADRVFGLSPGASPSSDRSGATPSVPGNLIVLRRLVLATGGSVVLYLLGEQWLVDRLGVISTDAWARLRPSLVTAALSLLVGYAAWELLHDWTRRKVASLVPPAGPSEEDEAATPSSRLSTAVPLLRLLLGVGIVIMSALVALSQLGIDVGPLVAGAGIFGLAISFGSQALVRDIVSGIFFLIDDAFRIGEYIDTGRLKGTVEKISVRSVQLRHQNGQIHTIPFGQLTSITNFSRDWATIKFNLRLTRDADVEKVRKTVKRVGEDMLRDAELGPEFLLPLKLQGIADVADNALVCRVKFTARPVRPTWVQREALKRIHEAFKNGGIEFATNAVTVQATGPAVPLAAAAGVEARRAAATVEGDAHINSPA
jgi:small-conductance mechanosensitive channel